MNLENKDTLIIFGLGMGYHVDRIIRAYPNMNKLIIEPSADIFKCMLKHRDISGIVKAKNVELVVTDDPNQIIAEITALYRSGLIGQIEFLTLPSYQRIFGTLLLQTKDLYARFLRTLNVNVRTHLLFMNQWLRNVLLNLKFVPESADMIDLAESMQNVPAVLVSAGPSLNKNIELLREISDKALILAAGSTVSVLQNAGIKPHIMLGIDGSQAMADIYSKVQWTDILFAYILSIHPGCLDNYTGPKLYLRSNVEPQVAWMEQSINHVSKYVQSGGSCANVALDFLKKLGCNPVIFIGQDLAFTDMQLYADGHINKETRTLKGVDESKLRLMKDIYGQDIYTADYLLIMAYCFEDCIKRQSEDSIFINATEGGLPIKGTRVMTFREAIDTYCSEDRDVINKLNSLVTQSRCDNEILRDGIKEFVLSLQKHSERVGELSSQRIKHVERILKEIDNNNLKKVSNLGKKLLPITEEIEQNELSKIVLYPQNKEALLVIKNNSEAQANQTANIREKMRTLYEGLKNQFQLTETCNNTIGEATTEAIDRLNREV